MIPDELTIALNWKGQKREWSFDSVFGATTHQDKVFEDTKHLIQSAVDGYNVCIFACEQGASGSVGGACGGPQRGRRSLGFDTARTPPSTPPASCPAHRPPASQTARRAAARPSPSMAMRSCRA